jgi:hypothetical protein
VRRTIVGSLGSSDIAVDSGLDTRVERVGLDEDDQVELEPLGELRVSDRTRGVAWNAEAPMTQATPSEWVVSQVSRILSRSEVDPWTTGTPLSRMEVGTLVSGESLSPLLGFSVDGEPRPGGRPPAPSLPRPRLAPARAGRALATLAAETA